MWLSRCTLLAAAFLSLTVVSTGQQAPAAHAAASVDDAFVHQQFGSNCSLIGQQPLTGDLDGDSVEDVVIPAHCTRPMQDEAENSYQVIDPFNAFFGYGNPAITTQFSTEDPQRRGYSLLIIHGAGPDAWRSAKPKAKFMVVNLPFNQVIVKKLVMKKKTLMAIYVEESGGAAMMSVLFWDGKKYRYQPMGSTLE
jgi:hypothetical protein